MYHEKVSRSKDALKMYTAMLKRIQEEELKKIIKNGQVTINHVPRDKNPIDLLTKALELDRH